MDSKNSNNQNNQDADNSYDCKFLFYIFISVT